MKMLQVAVVIICVVILSFLLGREWEQIKQQEFEEMKKRKPITRIPQRWE